MSDERVLEITDLDVFLDDLKAVHSVTFSIGRGQRMGLVGESGAGKSLTALAIVGLLPTGWRSTGTVRHDGVDLLHETDRSMSRRRGRTLSMIFQDPLSALNPTRRIGQQITQVIRRHTRSNADQAKEQAINLLRQMNLPRPESIMRAFPHQLSGGQRQRIMIAMAVSCYPELIIADEPTTALDVTVQKQVLSVLDSAVSERGSALLMITHDLPIIAAMCDTVAVMYGGRIVELGPVETVFRSPLHPYTKGLLQSQPTFEGVATDSSARLASIPGIVPTLSDMPSGCAFRTRCSRAIESCGDVPDLSGDAREVACWNPLEDLHVRQTAR